MINTITNNQNTYSQNKTKKPAFGNLANAATWAIKGIENGGVLVDFCLVDSVSMVFPRTYQAYHRNEEELGHKNYKAGNEELIREIFSGPTMFVVPAVFLALSRKIFGKASDIQFKTLETLTDSYKKTLHSGKTDKKEFYKGILTDAFSEHRKIKLDNPINIDEHVEKIADKFLEAETAKKQKPVIEEIKTLVSDLNKAHSLHLGNSHTITLKNGLTKEIGALSKDLIRYSQDIVAKVSTNPELLDKLHKSRVNYRRGVLAGIFAATTAVLYSIPILYKRNKQFPGIDGLVLDQNGHKIKEENDLPHQPNGLSRNDKKQVSFGANTSKIDKFFKRFDFNGTNVPYPILAFYTLGMMLGARWFQARNADERREVATRDFSGLTTLVFAVPVIRNITSALAKKFSGIPIAEPIKSKWGFFNPNKKPFSFENINDVYSGISKYKNGIADFAQNIHNHGGNLGKVLGHLTEESKNALTSIAPDFFKKSNKEIIETLTTAHKSEEHKPFIKIVEEELNQKGNRLVKRAEALKSVPEAASIVAISAFLGWFLPWFNINHTKKIYKDKEKQQQIQQIQKKPTFNTLVTRQKPAFQQQNSSNMLKQFRNFTGQQAVLGIN